MTGVQTCALPISFPSHDSPTLSHLSVSDGPESRLRHRCSSQYLRISPLHWEFHSPLPNSSLRVSSAIPRLSPGLSRLTTKAACAPFTPSNSEQRLPPSYYRGCWHEVSRAYSAGTVIIVPAKRALQPEGLHHSRGIAGSGLPPLSNIPHCCLP